MKKCIYCGFDNDDGSKFCVSCGTGLPEATVAPQVTPEPVYQAAPAPQPTIQPAPAPSAVYQPPYQQSASAAAREAAPKTNGLCITGFVLAICSIVTLGLTSLPGLIFSICGCASAKKKKQKGKGFAIAGIVISAIALLFLALYIVCAVFFMDEFWEDYGDDIKSELETRSTYADLNIKKIIKNENWVLERQGSYLVFESNSRFRYYETYGDDDSSYYEGTYEIYVGRDAIEYVSEDLEEYGVTEEEIEELLAADKDYCEENFVCIVLNNESCMVDGVNTLDEEVVAPYIGNYLIDGDESGLDLTNMNQATHVFFVPEDQYND